jgi:sodium/bile acid cotransporter 7
MLPFAAGQILRPWIATYLTRHPRVLGSVDYGSILILVYAAFSHGVVDGIWHQIGAGDLFKVALVDIVLLAAVMTILTFGSRQLGFSRPDEITIVFCGSKKSLASGLPMATVLLSGQPAGLIVLPLMLFHQIQLMVCASLARYYAAHQNYGERIASGSRSLGLSLRYHLVRSNRQSRDR